MAAKKTTGKKTKTQAAPRAAKAGAKAGAKGKRQPAKKTASGNQDYKNFGGWLLVWYWLLIIGGILGIITTAWVGLYGLYASYQLRYLYAYSSLYSSRIGIGFGPAYIIGILVRIATWAIAAVFWIRSARQMKARQPRFFDTFMLGTLIFLGGSIVSSLFYGVVSFISSLFLGVIFTAIGLGLVIMYFSKSVRVKVYFSGRPLHKSKWWDRIKKLPEFIIGE